LRLSACSSIQPCPQLLHASAHHGARFSPQLLHEHGAPLDAIAEGDGGATPFLTACSNGKLDILIWLKQAGANLKATGDEGQDGLSIAAREGYLKVVKWLHEVSANECIPVRLMAL
jgi:ankyrin repeat protein